MCEAAQHSWQSILEEEAQSLIEAVSNPNSHTWI